MSRTQVIGGPRLRHLANGPVVLRSATGPHTLKTRLLAFDLASGAAVAGRAVSLGGQAVTLGGRAVALNP